MNIEEIKPWLDKENKFMAFMNTKCGSTSVHILLESRLFRWVHVGNKRYMEKLRSIDSDKLFKFTIVRNPWDRVVSSFLFLQQQVDIIDKNVKFKDFVLNELPKYDLTKNIIESDDYKRFHIQLHFRYQYLWCAYDFVDFVARLDNIQDDWSFIASKIDCSPILLHARKSKRSEYWKYYDDEVRNAVAEIYAVDIKILAYEFYEGV